MWKRSLILIFSCCFALAPGQDLADTRALAAEAEEEGHYPLAIRTWLRVLYFSPPQTRDLPAYRLAACFEETGEFREAVRYYAYSENFCRSDSLCRESRFGRARALIGMADHEEAARQLVELGPQTPEEAEKRRQFYLGVAAYRAEEFAASKGFFLAAARDSAHARGIEAIFVRVRKTGRLKPVVARIISYILPGSGQLYAGDPRNALNSLLLNAALVGAGVYVGVAVGVVDAFVLVFPWFFRYYHGGAVNAQRIATKRLRQKRDALFLELLGTFETGK